MNYAPALTDWKCPHVGGIKTDVNENADFDIHLYAKVNIFSIKFYR